MVKIRHPKDFFAGLMFIAFGLGAIVIGSVVLFAMTVSTLGLVLSSILLIFVSSAASKEFRWKEALVSGAILAALSVAGFIWGLGLQFSIWPTFIGGR